MTTRTLKQIIVAYRDHDGQLVPYATAYDRKQADLALAALHRDRGIWGIRMDHREFRRRELQERVAA